MVYRRESLLESLGEVKVPTVPAVGDILKVHVTIATTNGQKQTRTVQFLIVDR